MQPQNPISTGSPGEVGSSSLSSTDPNYSATPRAPSTAKIEKGTVDQARSNELTDYLRGHQLPLVSSQIVNAPGGREQVILFGYVAHDFGQIDAEAKARKFLNNSQVVIDNRIKVSPELAGSAGQNAGSGSSALPSTQDDFDSLGSAQSYQNQQAYDPMQQQQQQQYQSQSQMGSSGLTALLPLLGLFIGSGSSFGGGGYGGYGGYGGGYGGYPGYGGGFGGYPGYGGGYGGYPPPMMPPPSGYGTPPPGTF